MEDHHDATGNVVTVRLHGTHVKTLQYITQQQVRRESCQKNVRVSMLPHCFRFAFISPRIS